MLQQALVALLVNAAEAMPDAGSVEVRSSTDEEQVRIEVADTGVGISAETLPTIFEPFFSTKGEEKGAGLGLAVVYGIVRSHGGTIEVDSTLGAGSVFRISLPRRGPATA
jgi:signal transduction histidine kinase